MHTHEHKFTQTFNECLCFPSINADDVRQNVKNARQLATIT